jgi:hypothetical protein
MDMPKKDLERLTSRALRPVRDEMEIMLHQAFQLGYEAAKAEMGNTVLKQFLRSPDHPTTDQCTRPLKGTKGQLGQ